MKRCRPNWKQHRSGVLLPDETDQPRDEVSKCKENPRRQEFEKTVEIGMKSWKKSIALFLILLMGLTAAQPLLADDTEQININQASQAELTELKGIGPVLSQRIVEYREEHGPFQSPKEIMDVKGIGPKTWEKNKDRITTE